MPYGRGVIIPFPGDGPLMRRDRSPLRQVAPEEILGLEGDYTEKKISEVFQFVSLRIHPGETFGMILLL
jgi:hypothetical protein